MIWEAKTIFYLTVHFSKNIVLVRSVLIQNVWPNAKHLRVLEG